MSDEGFLRRWARLKAQPEETVLAEPLPPPAALAPETGAARLTPLDVPQQEIAPPTIADAAALTQDSDFSSFVAKNVDAAVRRLAMKKLFADPHFHGHDGLDIYMGDYNLPSPVSPEMLADMSHNKDIFASLDEVVEQVAEQLDALTAAPALATPAPVETPPFPEPAVTAPPPPDQEVA